MIIEVTQDDIDAGETCSAHRCAVATAIRRTLGKPPMELEIKVWGREAQIGGKVVHLPDEVDEFTQLYDSEGDQGKRLVSPFTFELEIQQPEKTI